MPNNLGFDVLTESDIREDAFLFGESQSRVIVSIDPEKEEEFIDFMVKIKFPFSVIGHITKGKIVVDDQHFGMVEEYKTIYDNVISNKMKH